MRFASVGAALTLLSGIALAAPDTPTTAYGALVDGYFKDRFAANPIEATDTGVHDYDAKLPDLTEAAHLARRKALRDWLGKAAAIDPAGLPEMSRDDLAFLISTIKGQLLADEQVALWRKDPNLYLVLATDSVFGLIKRDFAPAADRLKSATSRERQIPVLLATAKANLTQTAPIYVDIALEQIDGTISFFKNDAPGAFAGVADKALQAEFATANQGVIAALGEYKAFLQQLRPKATGAFAIGRAAFQEKLLDEDMVDLPVDKILEVGMTQLRKDQAALAEAARRIDPGKSADAVLAQVESDHVAADRLIPTARDQLTMLRRFVIDRKIVTVPGEEQPIVTETPPFARATTFASMDAPAALETHARESYYYITLPDPTWPAAKQEEYLRGYNTPLLQNVSVHEVWPGHFVQHLYDEADKNRSLVRRVLSANTTVEGWAHYTEQMMLDEGLGNGDPRLRMMQAIDALLRDCRLVVGIRIHTTGMSLADARKFFVEEGHQQPVVGEMEVKRGTEDPTYLYYALGKLAILKLRADYRAKMGDRFSLLDFHDRFNRAGVIPLKLIRRELMGADGPLL